MQLSTISSALTSAHQEIDRVDANMLLQHVLQVDQAFLLTHPQQTLTVDQCDAFSQLIRDRVRGKPVAYLIGERPFYDLVLKVDESVLIPRPETELLVDWALKLIPADQACRILDLGTGSGAIALTIARHCPNSQVVGVDLSVDALAVAQCNADILRITNVQFMVGNWFDELSSDRFDLIISNPPYVAENDSHLQQGDLRFEPKLALSAGEDGMACLTHIIQAAPNHLVREGWLLLEHGYDQAELCRRMLGHIGFNNICSLPDLAGIMRVSGGQLGASR